MGTLRRYMIFLKIFLDRSKPRRFHRQGGPAWHACLAGQRPHRWLPRGYDERGPWAHQFHHVPHSFRRTASGRINIYFNLQIDTLIRLRSSIVSSAESLSRVLTFYQLQGTDPEDVIKNAFGCFDDDNSGVIHEDRLRELLTTMGDRFTDEGPKTVEISSIKSGFITQWPTI